VSDSKGAMAPPPMTEPRAGWGALGTALAARYARSSFRLARDVAIVAALFLPLFLLRGSRLVLLVGGAGVGFAIACFLFAHPFPTLLLALGLAYAGVPFVPGITSTVLLALVTARLVYDLLAGRRVDLGPALQRLSFAVFVTVGVASTVAARDPGRVGRSFVEIGIGAAVYTTLSAYVDSTRRLRIVLVTLVVGLGIGTAINLARELSAGILGLAALAEARFTTPAAAEANASAMVLNTVIPCALVLAAWTSWRRAWVFWISFVLLLVAIVISSSRAGVGVCGLVVSACLVTEKKLRKHLLWLPPAVAITLAVLPSQYWGRFVSIHQFGGIILDRSLQLRQHALEATLDLFRHHVWLGVGLGNVVSNTPRYMMLPLVAHNSYAEIAASTGIFGFAAYAGWVGSGAWEAWANLRSLRRRGATEASAYALALFAGLVSFLLTALTLSVQFQWPLWIGLGLTNALRRQRERAGGDIPSVVGWQRA